LFEVPIMLNGGSILNRMSLRACYACGVSVYAVQMLVWAVVSDPLVTGIVMMFRGFGFGMACIATIRIANSMVPGHLQNTGQLLASTVAAGLAPVIGAFAGGILYAQIGAPSMFILCAAITTVGCGVVWISLAPQQQTAKATPRLLIDAA
jgi:predicted MFS family arabinose efflux permease